MVFISHQLMVYKAESGRMCAKGRVVCQVAEGPTAGEDPGSHHHLDQTQGHITTLIIHGHTGGRRGVGGRGRVG